MKTKLFVFCAIAICVIALVACAAPVPTATPVPPKQVLVILATEKSQDWPLMLTNEVGVMVSMLEKAGYKAVVASVSGQSVGFGSTTLKPDLKLADAKADDYAGVIVPCLAPNSSDFQVPPEAAAIVKNAVAQGKPVAAQLTGVFTLAKAGVLNGKQFAILSGYQRYVPDGIYIGEGVVQDGSIVTSGTCPKMAMPGKPDGTPELTKKFIALLASTR